MDGVCEVRVSVACSHSVSQTALREFLDFVQREIGALHADIVETLGSD